MVQRLLFDKTDDADALRRKVIATLSRYPAITAHQLAEKLKIDTVTVLHTIPSMGDVVVRIKNTRLTQYALRDNFRGLHEFPVYRVSREGEIRLLGMLIPVRPDGFVMRQENGTCIHSEGIPWWLLDMRPQGFLGRAYAQQYGDTLGFSRKANEWTDTQAIRALLLHGADAVGNLLLGDAARDRFIHAEAPIAIPMDAKGQAYIHLAASAAMVGDTWSSAGGEQPKFCTYADTVHGKHHLLVKFTVADANPVTERWRDLLLAEHLAMETLHSAGISAARSDVVDCAGQRFLEVVRFDRIGISGRQALLSLEALNAEFVGDAYSPWSVVTATLAKEKMITPKAAANAALLYAFGTLIGNEDMHNGNLSFISEHGRPYSIAPAYDMLPMGFRPQTSGKVRNLLNPANLHASVNHAIWRQALELAQNYLQNIKKETRWNPSFQPCIEALSQHIATAAIKIEKMG